VNAVGRRWPQTDHFDWLSLYLNTRGIRLIWRAMVAAVIASISMVPVVVLVRAIVPHYPAAAVVAPIASGFGVIVALFWLIRWPTRGQSELFSLTGSVCIIARFGGDEFVVADTYGTDDLLDIAERLRIAIAAIDYPITASIGIATAPPAVSFAPAERELIDDLVNLADTAMYAAKHAGGNQSRSAQIPHADLKGSPA
jgi:hypothetical protein